MDSRDTTSMNSPRPESNEVYEVSEEEIYLSLFHASGQLGAAFYNVPEGILYIMNDLVDPAPRFSLMIAILSQVNPKHILISSRHNELFAKAVKESVDENTSNNETSAMNDDSAARDTNEDSCSRTTIEDASTRISAEESSISKLGSIEESTFSNMSAITKLEDVFNGMLLK